MCNQCFNAYRRLLKLRQKSAVAFRIAAQINRAASDHAAVTALARRMIDELGGLEVCVSIWRSALCRAMESGRSTSVLKGMQAIANLLATADRPVNHLEPVERMTDQKLKAEVLECLSHLTPDELAELTVG